MTAFQTMQNYYMQRDLAAREWKRKGGKVVGYFCNDVPEEIIIAAGFFPLRISGDPHGGTEEIDKYLENYYEGFMRSSLNMMLTEQYDFLDFIVVPRSRNSIAQAYPYLLEITALDPSVNLPEMYLFEFLHQRSYASESYFNDRVSDFKKKMEEWSGTSISDSSLSKAIAVTNENKALLKKVAELRAADSPRISGVEALKIIGSSMFMMKEDHNKLLTEYLNEADKLPARNGCRLFVEGSPLDNLQFYEAVESCNATIVAEDNCWGNRYSDDPIDASGDPLSAIFKRYHGKSPCPYVNYPAGIRKQYCMDKVTESKAQGVVFYILQWDNAGTWEFPELDEALKEMNIPTLLFVEENYFETGTKNIKSDVEKFIGKLG